MQTLSALGTTNQLVRMPMPCSTSWGISKAAIAIAMPDASTVTPVRMPLRVPCRLVRDISSVDLGVLGFIIKARIGWERHRPVGEHHCLFAFS